MEKKETLTVEQLTDAFLRNTKRLMSEGLSEAEAKKITKKLMRKAIDITFDNLIK